MIRGAPTLAIVLLWAAPAAAQSYREVGLEAGIRHVCYDPHRICGGAVFFDYDGDGWEDLFLTGGRAPSLLYRNLGDGTFEDVTERAGLGILARVTTMGAAAGDIDNDGDRDLFVATWSGFPNVLLRNEGDGTFVDVAAIAGVAGAEEWSTVATFGDYDLDGFLDLYVGNYALYDDLPFDEHLIGGIPNRLYHNRGDGTFEEVAGSLGVDDPDGLALAVAFTDYDGDGDPDLFVGNDFGYLFEPNALFRNDHPAPRFTNVAESADVDFEMNAMGVAIGDWDDDGDVDLHVTNMGDNSLHANQGGDRFRDVAAEQGLEDRNSTGWGTAFLDYDNDGFLDLLVVNGRVLPQYDLQNLDHVRRLLQAQDNRLYRGGGGDGTFVEVTYREGVADSTRGRGLAVADYDRDGDMDYVVVVTKHLDAMEGRTLLFRNERPADRHWLEVDLEGTRSNRDGIGARVEAWTGGRRQIREIDGGSSYMSHHSTTAHFGLGGHARVDSLVVVWPGGRRQPVADVPADRLVRIVEETVLAGTEDAADAGRERAGSSPLPSPAESRPAPSSPRPD